MTERSQHDRQPTRYAASCLLPVAPILLLFQWGQTSCTIHLSKHATGTQRPSQQPPQLLLAYFIARLIRAEVAPPCGRIKHLNLAKITSHFCLSLLKVNMTVNCFNYANVAHLEMSTIYKSDYYICLKLLKWAVQDTTASLVLLCK